MKPPEQISGELTLAGEILTLIADKGPMHNSDIANRLGVASRHRFKAAMQVLLQTGRAEKLNDREPGLRASGDRRPIPPSTLHQIAARRRRARRGRAVRS